MRILLLGVKCGDIQVVGRTKYRTATVGKRLHKFERSAVREIERELPGKCTDNHTVIILHIPASWIYDGVADFEPGLLYILISDHFAAFSRELVTENW